MNELISLASNSKNVTELNRSCYCLSLDRSAILKQLKRSSSFSDIGGLIEQRENLFAASGVFLSRADRASMLEQIRTIEAVAQSRRFQDEVLSNTDAVLNSQTTTRGVLMGYDFHISVDGPRLIEINTNAGGAFLVNALEKVVVGSEHGKTLTDMFVREWQLAVRPGRLRTVAIVDKDPGSQYLYPDMRLAQRLLVSRGIQTLIVQPEQFDINDGRLMIGETPVDLVYNRLTDFDLSQGAHSVIRRALLEDLAVVTPSPRHHALIATKRNLSLLSDEARLLELGVHVKDVAVLAKVPKTQLVDAADADSLWRRRKNMFFKPVDGYGSKAAFRGDKLTRKVWKQILTGDFVAQEIVSPTTRAVVRKEDRAELKYDVRVYTHAGHALSFAARMYQGQTTNFRTEGGGLALVVDEQLAKRATEDGDHCCQWMSVLKH